MFILISIENLFVKFFLRMWNCFWMDLEKLKLLICDDIYEKMAPTVNESFSCGVIMLP